MTLRWSLFGLVDHAPRGASRVDFCATPRYEFRQYSTFNPKREA